MEISKKMTGSDRILIHLSQIILTGIRITEGCKINFCGQMVCALRQDEFEPGVERRQVQAQDEVSKVPIGPENGAGTYLTNGAYSV